MEITAKPRRRGWLRVLRAVVVLGTMWAVALLIPPALGLQTHVVDEDTMSGSFSRGALAFDEQISPRQLEVGDVVTFVPPDADADAESVTRRVVGIGDTHFTTRADAANEVDAWLLPLGDGELRRVALALPWVGYPILVVSAVTVPVWVWAVLAVGLGALLVLARRGSAREEVRAPSAAALAPPLR